MGPGLYSDIGKKARDLLYRDFQTDQKFTLTTYAANGAIGPWWSCREGSSLSARADWFRGRLYFGAGRNLGDRKEILRAISEAITAASTKKNEAIFSEIQIQVKNKNVTLDVKATSDSLLLTTITSEDLGVPGLKKIITIPFPYQTAGKGEFQYQNDYAGISASFGLNSKPLVNLSGVFGNKTVAVGADVAYDTATGNFIKYNAGVTFTNADLIAAATLNNKGDSLTASYYQLVDTVNNTAVGAEVTHSFSTNENTFTFGTQHILDPLTTLKARYNNHGMASALIQHEWKPKSFFTLSTEVDTKAIDKNSKVGLSLVLKP
ncbi:hypothetical protein ACP4OV_029624 [Aristida adscensionis]